MGREREDRAAKEYKELAEEEAAHKELVLHFYQLRQSISTDKETLENLFSILTHFYCDQDIWTTMTWIRELERR